MFEGFKHIQVQTSDPEVKINLRYGGDGPPVLLIHGNPLTHVHWHLVAPRLAKDFTVVATDLRGYGDSGKPRGTRGSQQLLVPPHGAGPGGSDAAPGLRALLRGRPRPRRARRFRMALDHPDRVQKFASFDIIPTHHVLTHANWQWALNSYHWFFMAQPYDIPGEADRRAGRTSTS